MITPSSLTASDVKPVNVYSVTSSRSPFSYKASITKPVSSNDAPTSYCCVVGKLLTLIDLKTLSASGSKTFTVNVSVFSS